MSACSTIPSNPLIPAVTLRRSAIVLCLGVFFGGVSAEEYLSNLGTRWVDPGTPSANSIGDIQAMFPGQSPFTVQFFTGTMAAGTNTGGSSAGGAGMIAPNPTNVVAFGLDSVTYEFIHGQEQAWSDVSVQLYRQAGSTSNLVGELGNPVVNPGPTQWPQTYSSTFCTTYVDYHPRSEIRLQPSSEYWLAVGVASGRSTSFGILFGLSPTFVTSTDWQMGMSLTHTRWAAGEFLKVAIRGTAILSVTTPHTALSAASLSVSQIGTKLVLSWPASAAPCRLYAMPNLQPPAWAPVSAAPVLTNDSYVVTLPLADPCRYFRLQAE